MNDDDFAKMSLQRAASIARLRTWVTDSIPLDPREATVMRVSELWGLAGHADEVEEDGLTDDDLVYVPRMPLNVAEAKAMMAVSALSHDGHHYAGYTQEELDAVAIAAMRDTSAFIATARASMQTTFEIFPGFVSIVMFVTDVPDAPLQVLGHLGRDGRWYINFYINAPHHPNCDLELPNTVVLRDEPVAVAMIRYAIDRMLNAARTGDTPQGFAEFKARLMWSRFRKEAGK